MDQLDAILTRRPIVRPLLLTGTIVVVLIACASLAHAHAFPSSTQPRVGSTVSKSPDHVQIIFDSPIEKLFAKLDVLDSGGHDVSTSAPTLSADHRQLSVPIKPLPPGDYTVKWSVVAFDGHHTEGSFQFTVGGGS